MCGAGVARGSTIYTHTHTPRASGAQKLCLPQPLNAHPPSAARALAGLVSGGTGKSWTPSTV